MKNIVFIVKFALSDMAKNSHLISLSTLKVKKHLYHI